MAKLIRFGKEMSLEEYVIAEGCANYGSHTSVTIPVLKQILDKQKIPYKKSATKEELIRRLYEYCQDWGEVARNLNVGVKINQYAEAFPFVTKADIKRLEKFEVLKVIGYQQFRLYGHYRYAVIYDMEQYVNMTAEQMQTYLKEYPKGKRNNQQHDK